MNLQKTRNEKANFSGKGMGGVSCSGVTSNSQLNSTPHNMLKIANYKAVFESKKYKKARKRRAKSGEGGIGGVLQNLIFN